MIADALRPLEWLVGEWEAQPDESGATGGSRFTLAASGHALIRTSWAEYPDRGTGPRGRHDDVVLIHPDGDRYERRGSDEAAVRFEMALPGGRLVPYVSGALRRPARRDGRSSAPDPRRPG